MRSIFLCLFLLSGCVKQNIIEFAGKDFVHTSSLCLDAILVNMDKNLCSSPSIVSSPGGVLVSCERDMSETGNFWNDSQFLMIPTIASENMDPGYVVCSDPNYTIFYVPKLEEKESQ
tara:strand:- start:426 stop:776 length:351 start_codon:yes stop_codon:yes gene_type:complete